MNRQSHIVSFDDARRGARGYRGTSDMRAYGRATSSRAEVRRGSRSVTRAEANGETRSELRKRSASREGLNAESRGLRGMDVESYGSRARAGSRGEASSSASEAASKTSFVGRMHERMGSAHRSRVKSKADRRFSQQYGESAGRGSSEPAGPRAAVYKGEMGSSHKKAARMQNDVPDKTRGRSALAKKRRTLSPALAVSVAIAACLALGCVSLYSPAQQYYQEIRERDRLQAEYAAVQQRNDAIQSEVDALSTSAGIEDRAREEFGWVKNDEVAGSVAGLDIEDDSSFRANIIPGSIEAPETWYSFLDPFFGVS